MDASYGLMRDAERAESYGSGARGQLAAGQSAARRTVGGVLLVLSLTAAAMMIVASDGTTSAHKVPMVVQATLQEQGQKGWRLVERADGEKLIQLNLMLKLNNEAKLEELASAVSDPAHAEYGKHRSVAELDDLIRPPADHVATVEAWLLGAGVPQSALQRSPSGDIISVTVPIKTAESLLGTEYGVYQLHKAAPGRTPITRAAGYSLPADVSRVVDWVGPTVEFPMVHSIEAHGEAHGDKKKRRAQEHAPHHHRKSEAAAAAPAAAAAKATPTATQAAATKAALASEKDAALAKQRSAAEYNANAARAGGFVPKGRKAVAAPKAAVTPLTLKRWYDMPEHWVGGAEGNSQAVVGFLEQHSILQEDLDAFTDEYARDTSPRTTVEVHGEHGAAGIESTLDVEYIMGMAVGVPTKFYYYGSLTKNADGDVVNEPFLEWLREVGRMADHELPLVFSVSYADWEPSVPKDYAKRVDKAFMILAARGVSVIVASGDGGVEGAGPLPHDAWQHECNKGDRLIASFPASSPWVTSVGAVTGFPEVAAEMSGGGFSEYFDRPSYQADDTALYLSHCDPTQFEGMQPGYDRAEQADVDALEARCTGGAGAWINPPLPDPATFNKRGRGIPDVSMQGLTFSVHFQHMWRAVSGTSAATPTFAAMVSAVNDERLRDGHGPVGFLNPALYSASVRTAFDDVTEGNNPGCGVDGFFASAGWDPVTGLGVPNYERLKAALLQLANRGGGGGDDKHEHGHHNKKHDNH